jgi:two-component system, LytTR family, response regulator
MNKLKTLIVDDNWLFREELKKFLRDYPEIELVAEAETLSEAIKKIKAIKPHVLFLDIQLAGESGFELFDKTDVTAKTIFITAYDQYAIRAFEMNALDYLLKPIRKERLTLAINKLVASNESHEGYLTNDRLEYDDIIYLIIDGSLKFIKVSRLKCIVAERNYSYIIYDGKKKELISKTLSEWEKKLPEKFFVRIHRSTIINFEYVEKVKKRKNYTHEVTIKGIDEPFIISRRYAARLKKKLT